MKRGNANRIQYRNLANTAPGTTDWKRRWSPGKLQLSLANPLPMVKSDRINESINKSNRVRTTDAFWRSARVLVSELSFKWHSFMFPMLFFSNSACFSEIQLVCDGTTDEPTDRRTDTHFYRDARTHLKNRTMNQHR